ncbi:phosphatase PAP2 family protein [Hydrogenophaga sp. BPS33]|uniref:phosphatase PAP2 family protein n=1 Tax=Hydrogenophaga sp. BPS33 TaxID=2651974 RepID=UPI00131FEF95|nr:phosphatase PAP2 family protein [Hydrogenophaga sp. BPS33]QHE87252.1 phosphatase PAP2 family protein [Hydrogenophaga sp. BPS33]
MSQSPAHPLVLSLAQWAGTHALALFIASMLGWLLLTWWFWRSVGSYARPRNTLHAFSWMALLVRMAIAFALIVAGAALFTEIAEALHGEQALGAMDDAFTTALAQSVPAAALQVFAAVTRLGDPATLTVLCAVMAIGLLWRGHRWLAGAWVASVAGMGLLNASLKLVFSRVRPVHDDGLVQATGFSFPSGHSSVSVVAYGMLAYLALRLLPRAYHLPVALAMTLLAGTIGASRLFLRVHFASDVAAGFSIGVVWLACCVACIELARHWSWWRASKG